MNTISELLVDQTWQEISQMSETELPGLISEMSDDQPLLLVYLMTVGEEILDEEEQELLLYLGVVVWKMMSKGEQQMGEVTEPLLDKVEQENSKMVEYLEGESEHSLADTVLNILGGYNQAAIFKYLVEAIVEAVDAGEIRVESAGILALYLKIHLDCLDQV
ncbi:MAG: hypothetical protein AAGI38_03970 [Bacteroidota bacterium]